MSRLRAMRATLRLLPAALCTAALHAQDPAVDAATATRPAQSATPATPTPKPAAMQGRVIDLQGRPLEGVAVRFSADRQILTADILREPTVRTGADGRFELSVEPPDDKWTNATLHVVHKGFAGAAFPGAPKYDREKKEWATERDFGDLVLIPGSRLFGRVRDAEGRPLPGARVVARDMFDSGRLFRGRSTSMFCAAAADTSGIFELPGAFAQAVRLEVTLDGHFPQVLQPVATGTPLEVALQPGGHVSGRVLDPEGRGVADATVTAAYEVRTLGEVARTGADGSFRLTLAAPARYRIRASQQREGAQWMGKTDVLEGPRDNLEIYLKEPEQKGAAAGGALTVKAVDKKTSRPVGKFQAVSVWEQYANQNANYLEHRLRQALRSGVPAEDGGASLPGPGQGAPSTGAVRVLAEGYAVATAREVEWKDIEPGRERPALVVELVPESALSGRVLDEGTGQPVAGARVWVRPQQNRGMGSYEGNEVPPDAVVTADDGTYMVSMLGEGTHEVTARHPQRPAVPPETVELRAEERRDGFHLKLPAGASVAGRLVGAAPGPGWKVFLQELPTFAPTGGGYSRMLFSGNQEPQGAVAVAGDGSFEFDGMRLADYRLVLMVPTPPRCGSHVYVALEPFRLRQGGLRREIDVSQDRPGTVRGRVTFPAAAVPFERVVIAARAVADDQQNAFFHPLQNDWSGPRAFVDRSGEFELVLGPGRHALEAADIQTGVRLGTTAAPLQLASGATAGCAIELRLLEFTVKLVPEQEGKVARADRLETRVIPKDQKEQGRMFGGNDQHDFGVGIDLDIGQRELRLVVPHSDVTLLLRSSLVNIREDDQRHSQQPLLRHEFEAQAEAPREIVLKLPPPPELPAAEAKAGAGDAEALGKPK